MRDLESASQNGCVMYTLVMMAAEITFISKVSSYNVPLYFRAETQEKIWLSKYSVSFYLQA